MTKIEQIGFELGCFIGFQICSGELEMMLAKYGLSPESSLPDCRQALRDHVGEERYQRGIRIIKRQFCKENAEWN